MPGTFYDGAIIRGLVTGLAKGEAKALTEIVVNILERRFGVMNDNVRKRIRQVKDLDKLRYWKHLACNVRDAASAQRVVDTIHHRHDMAERKRSKRVPKVPSLGLAAPHITTYNMNTDFYEQVFPKAFARAYADGFADGFTRTISEDRHHEVMVAIIIRILEWRLRSVKKVVRKRLLGETNLDKLRIWQDMAIEAIDAERANQLVNTICGSTSSTAGIIK